MNATVAKVAGWLQFAGQAVGQLFTNGLPSSPIGWIQLLGSLAMAVGIHASAKTDGTK